jgi:carboxypeptidase Taq
MLPAGKFDMEKTKLESNLEIFNSFQKKIKAYNYVLALSGWDYETEEPKNDYEQRIEKISIIYEAYENLKQDSDYKNSIKELYANRLELNEIDKRRVEVVFKDLRVTELIPTVELLAYNTLLNQSHPIWVEAREKNDFSLFAPYLEKIVAFNQKMIKLLETDDLKGYDVLLDMYEEGMTSQKYDIFFNHLLSDLVPFVLDVTSRKYKINPKLSKGIFPKEGQKLFNNYIIDQLGLDPNSRVLKESAHPFTSGTSKYDIRITTRYIEDLLSSSIFSTIHETGHGLYESHISDDLVGTCLETGVSMGIHESQSRLFENMLGRDVAFWKPHYPELVKIFPKLKSVSLDEFILYVNKPEKSFIRTEADELTYALHIMLRYEIEKELFNGKLKVKNLPKRWNQLFQKYFSKKVPSDTQGVLQDVHWAGGSFGYFPTYALGSAYAAQFYHFMDLEINVHECLLKNDFATINNWLTEHIHKFGSLKTPSEILKIATGEEFNPKYFIDYLIKKYENIK